MPPNGSNRLPNTVQIGEIEKTLLWAFAITGLKSDNYPDANGLDILIDFLATNYPTHTPTEIRHAFNLAVAGKLDVDPNHFQSFSASYIARILNGYVPVRVKARKSLQSNGNALKNDSQNMQTPDEKENIRKNYILECLIKPWKYFLKTGQLTFGITPMRIIYETLTNDLKLLDVTPHDKARLWKIAEESEIKKLDRQVTSLADYKHVNEIKKRIESEGAKTVLANEIRAKCYELAVKEFYHHCKTTGVDLADIIEKKL